MSRLRRLALAASFASILVAPLAGRAAVRLDPLQNDTGVYRVYFRDRLLGTENFSLEPRGDSVLVFSNVTQTLPMPDGDQALDKKVTMTVKALDYGLLGYSSEQNFLGKRLLRGLNVYDTTLTAFREMAEMGSAETYARPAGRVFVIDSQVFVLFDIMLRSLHGKMIGERPLAVVVLGEPRDSVMDITFRPGPEDTLRMAGRPRPARRVFLSDGSTEFHAWVSPRGSLLRLEQPAVGLRVDRVDPGAAAVPAESARRKPATKRPPDPPPFPAD